MVRRRKRGSRDREWVGVPQLSPGAPGAVNYTDMVDRLSIISLLDTIGGRSRCRNSYVCVHARDRWDCIIGMADQRFPFVWRLKEVCSQLSLYRTTWEAVRGRGSDTTQSCSHCFNSGCARHTRSRSPHQSPPTPHPTPGLLHALCICTGGTGHMRTCRVMRKAGCSTLIA